MINRPMWIELDGWQAKLGFSACHFIPNHPKCGCLHGHTYAMSVRVAGEQIDDFVIDFEDLRRCVAEICRPLDHKLLLASLDTDTQISRLKNEDIQVIVGERAKRYVFPNEDAMLLPINSVSAEDLCSYLLNELCNKLDTENVTEISVRLDEGLGQGAGSTRYFTAAAARTHE